jgi:adenosylcobinamide-phosphate synthase
VANWVPARVTAALTAACAPLVRDSKPAAVLRIVHRDGGAHPSPNAGRCEAAFAAALGIRLGGTNVYGGVAETRPELGEGRSPEPGDIRRSVVLSRAVTVSATALAVLIALRPWRRSLPAEQEAQRPDDQRRDSHPPQQVQSESRAGDDQDDQQCQQQYHVGPPS